MPLPIRALAPRFDPRRIANLTGWFDALDSAGYVESSGQVSEWLDKSGSGNKVTQTTPNNRPTLFESSSDTQGSTRSVINGRQSLFFDGANDRLETANTVTSGQSRTVFAVARRIDNLSVGTVAQFGNDNVRRWLCRYGTAANPHVGGDRFGTNQNLAAGVQSAWTSAHISCWSQTSATRNLSYFLNGTELTVTGNPPNSQLVFTGLAIGWLDAGITQFFTGHMGALVVYDRELSAQERAWVTRELAAQWGISVA